jgi:methyltransferase (TIGR00027 family)
MPAALVAVEQCFPQPQRLIDAFRMLPAGAKAFVHLLKPNWTRRWIIGMSERSNPGIWGGLLCRKRYIDDKLIDSAGKVQAIVNLGAGFDTRVYRLPAVSNMPVWEADQPENIAAKQDRLRQALGAIPAHITLVPLDFDRDDLDSALASRDSSNSRVTFFILEAVTQYLTEKGAGSAFASLAKAARGSRLAFTYVRKDFLEGGNDYGWKAGYKQFVVTKIWRFGLEPHSVPEFLSGYGWNLVEDIGYDELARKYVPTGRKLASTQVERMVYAEKA